MAMAEGGFHWDAEAYARSSQAQLGWARELIAKLPLQGHEAVLDIGCGDGKVTAEIARRVPRGEVVGIDSSEDMVRKARSAFASEGSPRISFQLMDARALAFDARFDVAFSNAVLHWLKEHRPMLKGVARSLKPGGRVLFQMGGAGNGEEIFAVAAEMIGAADWREYFADFQFPWGFHEPREYRAWCEEAGLLPRRIELLPREMVQQGVDGLADWIKTTWMPYTERLPADRREDFVREAVDRYSSAHPADSQGRILVKMVRLEVEAVKA
jgi:trans-aconitate 2-methyltransferase